MLRCRGLRVAVDEREDVRSRIVFIAPGLVGLSRPDEIVFLRATKIDQSKLWFSPLDSIHAFGERGVCRVLMTGWARRRARAIIEPEFVAVLQYTDVILVRAFPRLIGAKDNFAGNGRMQLELHVLP